MYRSWFRSKPGTVYRRLPWRGIWRESWAKGGKTEAANLAVALLMLDVLTACLFLFVIPMR